MKELNLKLTGGSGEANVLVLIDGKPQKFKKNEFKNYECHFETENDKAKIEVYNLLDIGGFGWFVIQILLFLVSIFGIFDVHSKQRYLCMEYSAEIELKEKSSLTLRLNTLYEGKRAVEAEGDLKVEEVENRVFLNTKAKKIRKILMITKIVIAIVLVVTAVLVAMLVKK